MSKTATENIASDQPFEFDFGGGELKFKQAHAGDIPVKIRSVAGYEGDLNLTALVLNDAGEKIRQTDANVFPKRVAISPKHPASATVRVLLGARVPPGGYRVGVTARSVAGKKREEEALNAQDAHVLASACEKARQVEKPGKKTKELDDGSWGYFFKHNYARQVGDVFKGYGDTLNVFKAVDGAKQLASYARSHGSRAAGVLLLKGTIHSYTAFLTTSDPREFGQSFGTVLETVAPLGKKLPTPNVLKPIGEYEAVFVAQGKDATAVLRATRNINDAGVTFVARSRISKALKQAYKNVGEKRTGVRQSDYGTKVHTELKNQVKILGGKNIQPEISFRKGETTSYGKNKSVRLDVIITSKKGHILAVYDLKTGKATFTKTRIKQILNNLPEKSQKSIFRELRRL